MMNCSHSKTSNHHHHHEHQSAKQNDDHHSMMQMVFHGGILETILFEQWKTASVSVFISSWILVFILGMLYEAIKEFRQCLEEKEPTKLILKTTHCSNVEGELETLNVESKKSQTDRLRKKRLSYGQRITFAILYSIQMTISFLLMLIVMTFNIYLFIAVILGVGTGHLLYTMARLSSLSNKNEQESN